MVEYGILLALIAVVALGAIQALGGGIAAFFGRLLVHFRGWAEAGRVRFAKRHV